MSRRRKPARDDGFGTSKHRTARVKRFKAKHPDFVKKRQATTGFKLNPRTDSAWGKDV